jgi:hypothetical protein
LPDDAGLNELIVKASGLWGLAKVVYRTRFADLSKSEIQ